MLLTPFSRNKKDARKNGLVINVCCIFLYKGDLNIAVYSHMVLPWIHVYDQRLDNYPGNKSDDNFLYEKRREENFKKDVATFPMLKADFQKRHENFRKFSELCFHLSVDILDLTEGGGKSCTRPVWQALARHFGITGKTKKG